MTTLSRDALLRATNVPTEVVHLPELGGSVTVRGMTGGERDAFEQSCLTGRGRNRQFNLAGVRAKLISYCVVDEDGRRLFADADVEQLGDIRADILDRIFAVAQRLSGMRDEDIDDLGKPLPSPEAIATSSSPSPSSSA